MTLTEIVTIIALFAGPVFGALIAGRLQDRSESRKRKLEIFKMLMRNRRTMLNPSYVEALNLIEIEFYGNAVVLARLAELIRHLTEGFAKRFEEQHLATDNDRQRIAKDEIFANRIGKERHQLLIRLIHQIGFKLGYKLEQLDIVDGGYLPQYFFDLENEQREVRKYILDLSRGANVVPVGVMDYRSLDASSAA